MSHSGFEFIRAGIKGEESWWLGFLLRNSSLAATLVKPTGAFA